MMRFYIHLEVQIPLKLTYLDFIFMLRYKQQICKFVLVLFLWIVIITMQLLFMSMDREYRLNLFFFFF